MTHFKWLKKEIPRWVKEEIITREAGDSLISLYRNEQRHSHGEGLFVLAAVCFLTGLIFICAGVWNGLSQDEQFMMALVPLVLSILIIAAILWQDRPVMDQIPADRMYMAPEQLKKLSVVELSERVQVPEDNGKTKTAMKNEITALVRVKDGRAAISRVLANGGPVEQIFTTVGKNLSVKYATSKDEKDQYNEKRFFTAADMDKNGKESDNQSE